MGGRFHIEPHIPDPMDCHLQNISDVHPKPPQRVSHAMASWSKSCQWSSCQAVRFTNETDLAAHQNKHIKDLCKAASSQGIFQCQWPHCRTQQSSKDFKTIAAYGKHLKTHLIGRHWCTHVGCKVTKPFSRVSDLERHINTKHTQERTFFCPVVSCIYKTVGFPRKDKQLAHIRRQHEHEPFRCPFDHCHQTMNLPDEGNHMARHHFEYECKLTGCEGTTSRFGYLGMYQHVEHDHGVDIEKSDLLFHEVLAGRVKHPYLPCKTCTSKQTL
jgi:Rieske Fe-S protein